jgi:hypothetical protein
MKTASVIFPGGIADGILGPLMNVKFRKYPIGKKFELSFNIYIEESNKCKGYPNSKGKIRF